MEILLAAAIHDAKNALNALGVWLDKAQAECGQSAALNHAKAITATISGQLVELLALYRAGEGSLRMAVEDQYLEDFLGDLISELAATGKAEDADRGAAAPTIETDFAAAKKIGAWAFDAYLVKFVLLDALRNALRHAQQKIRFSLAAEPGGGIRFSVADDGPGYPDSILREETTIKMTPESSGLGLSFARVIAERHATPDGRHGRVELANDGLGGTGARLSLVLP